MKRKRLWSLLAVTGLAGCFVRVVLLTTFAYAAAECVHHNETVEWCGRYNPLGQANSDANENIAAFFEAFFMLFVLLCLFRWRHFHAENFVYELPLTPLFWALLLLGGLSCVFALFVRLVSNKSALLDISQTAEIGLYVVATPALQFVDVPLLKDDASSIAGKSPAFMRLTTTAWFCYLFVTLLRLSVLVAYDALSTARVLRVTPVGSTNEFDAIVLVMAVALRSTMLSVYYGKLFEWRTEQERRVVCGWSDRRATKSDRSPTLGNPHGGTNGSSTAGYRDLDSESLSGVSIALRHPSSDGKFATSFAGDLLNGQRFQSPESDEDEDMQQPLLRSTSTLGPVHAMSGVLLYG